MFIKKENLKPLLEKLGNNYDVYLPMWNKKSRLIDFYSISHLNENKDYEINLKEKTKKSAKFVFFPQTENIFDFEYTKDLDKPDKVQISIKENNAVNSDRDFRKKLIFGLKPCDTVGIKSLDLVFGEGQRKDTNYVQRRAGSILISIGCHLIFPDCFCVAVDGGPFNFEYSDIGLIDMGDFFAVLKTTEREDVLRLFEENKEFFEEKNFNEETDKKIKEIISSSKEKCRINWKRINADEININMDKRFKDEKIWKKMTDKCISCGACTFVCPTCVCFNIGDEIKDMSGERYKCWDFCTNYYYTLEASGHNPRSRVFDRYRNKINCKYNYFYKRNKNLYCVGCGRCVDICPVGMDIREIVGNFCEIENK